MCSYPSPESLLPPLELLSCAATTRELNGVEVHLFDAIAEKASLSRTVEFISEINPCFILTLTGFECYEQDINNIRYLKSNSPNTKWAVFGHYATYFPEETLKNSGADLVVCGEPEITFRKIIEAHSKTDNYNNLKGVAFFNNNDFFTTGLSERINDPNILPIPAYDLIPSIDRYYEPFMKKPYAMIQTTRGCPYGCNYCVKSYGSKLSQLKVDRIIEEIKFLKELHNIKTLRFIDDTFTINKKRVVELCNRLIQEKLDIEWMCLSRTDNIDESTALLMKEAGCKRIYFGVESGSQRMLDMLGKGIKANEAMTTLLMLRRIGIETAGFFLSGHPYETKEDFKESVSFAVKSKLSFVCFNPLQAYPGTPFFEQMRDKVHFSIYPYKLEWKDETINKKFSENKVVFYTQFYIRIAYFVDGLSVFYKYKSHVIKLIVDMLRYLFWDRRFVIGGIKGPQDK